MDATANEPPGPRDEPEGPHWRDEEQGGGRGEAQGGEEDEAADEIPARRMEAWRRRSAIGSIATGIALGLQDVFQPGRNTPVLTAEAPGDPPDADELIRVILDPEDPAKSIAIVPPGMSGAPGVD